MIRKSLCIISIILAGCTEDSYRRDADRQVQRLLKDRTEKTLGYQPRTEITPTPATRPSRAAYATLPMTALPPPTAPAIEPGLRQRPWTRLGPVQRFDPSQNLLNTDDLGAQLALRASKARLRLGPPTPGGPPIATFELFSALQYAIDNSRTYRTGMEQLYLAALDVTLQRHLFEPRPFASTGLQFSGGQLDANYRSALTAVNSIGVRQQLPYGGEVVARAMVNFIQALDDNSDSGEDASLVLQGSIPLLRGAGMVNLEPLIDSERSLVYQVRTFEEFRRAFVVDVASSYFDLVNAQNQIGNNLISYINSTNLVVRLEDLYAAGRVSNFLQVQQARQQQLSSENSLIRAQQDYQNRLDDFKVLIGMPVEQPLRVVSVTLDVPLPNLETIDFVGIADKHRLGLQTARDQIQDAKRGVANAANGLLADLTLEGQGQIGNRVGTPAINVDTRNLAYSANLTLDLPLDRLRERNAYRSALISYERAQRAFVTLRENVFADVRTSVRSLQSSLITLYIQRRSIELAQRRVEYSNELLTQGKAQARDVTESLQSLLNAQNSYDRARADLQIQILRLLRDTGTLRVDPKAGTLGSVMDGPTIDLQQLSRQNETWPVP